LACFHWFNEQLALASLNDLAEESGLMSPPVLTDSQSERDVAHFKNVQKQLDEAFTVAGAKATFEYKSWERPVNLSGMSGCVSQAPAPLGVPLIEFLTAVTDAYMTCPETVMGAQC